MGFTYWFLKVACRLFSLFVSYTRYLTEKERQLSCLPLCPLVSCKTTSNLPCQHPGSWIWGGLWTVFPADLLYFSLIHHTHTHTHTHLNHTCLELNHSRGKTKQVYDQILPLTYLLTRRSVGTEPNHSLTLESSGSTVTHWDCLWLEKEIARQTCLMSLARALTALRWRACHRPTFSHLHIVLGEWHDMTFLSLGILLVNGWECLCVCAP